MFRYIRSTSNLSDNDIRQILEDEGFEFTADPREAIYVLRNGDLVSGFHDGVRGEDHRMIEALFDDMDRYSSNFWSDMFDRTGVVMLIPETQTALFNKGQNLTPSQKLVIDKLGYDIIQELRCH